MGEADRGTGSAGDDGTETRVGRAWRASRLSKPTKAASLRVLGHFGCAWRRAALRYRALSRSTGCQRQLTLHSSRRDLEPSVRQPPAFRRLHRPLWVDGGYTDVNLVAADLSVELACHTADDQARHGRPIAATELGPLLGIAFSRCRAGFALKSDAGSAGEAAATGPHVGFGRACHRSRASSTMRESGCMKRLILQNSVPAS